MKQFYALILVLMTLMLAPTAEAQVVSRSEAEAKAAQFFTKELQTRTAPQFEMIWDGESMATRASSEPTFYIFNRTDGAGFVIIAGDEAASTVLGYSLENNFGKGEMPANLRWWLEGVRSTILEARANGVVSQNEQALHAGTPVVQLSTANWDQIDPYNRDCPTIKSGSRGLTGCVQTAAAILCKYNRWPDHAMGTAPGYTTETEKISVAGRTFGHTYNYDLMPDNYTSGSYTDEQANAVAKLMADLGVMNQADYFEGATGAYTSDLYATMTGYMRYSKQALLAHRSGYSDTEWITMLKKELDAGRPILYSGSSSDGGHAFICDGYDTENLFNFNWGWSGKSNGMYDVIIVASSQKPHLFTQGQDIIVDLVPDPEGTTTARDLLLTSVGFTETATYYGMSSDATSYAVGAPFTITMPVFNWGTASYTGKVVMAHFDAEGNKKGEISNTTNITNPITPGSGYIYTISCTITKEIERGDYAICLFWDNKAGKWEPIRTTSDKAPDRIILMSPNPTVEDLKNATTLSFDRTTRVLKIGTYEGTTCRLKSADGTEVNSATKGAEDISFDCSALKGKHTLEVQFEEVTPFTISLIF